MPYFILILSLLQPILALPLAFIEALKKKSKQLPIVCIALAFSMLTFTLVPFDTLDLYRHYQRIVSLRGLPLTTILHNAEPGYLIFDVYAWLVNELHLPKEFFPASIVFIAYYLVLSVFLDIKLNIKSNSKVIPIIFLIFWLSIGYIGLSSGLRNPLANIIVFFISYKLFFYKNRSLFFIGSYLAFLIHPFAIVPAIIIYLSYKLRFKSENAKIFIYLALVFSLSTSLITIGLEKILAYLSYLSFFKPEYFELDSDVGGAANQGLSTNEIIALVILPKIPIYMAYLYLTVIKPRKNDSLYLALCIISTYLGFFHSFGTVYNRMALFFLFLFAVFISLEAIKSTNRNFQVFFYFYTLALLAYSLMSIYTFRLYLITSLPELMHPLFFVLFGV